jgi:hypothetical protein
MNKTSNTLKSSELYRKIAKLPLTPAARNEAFAALEIAERLIGALTWTVTSHPATSSPAVPKTAEQGA